MEFVYVVERERLFELDVPRGSAPRGSAPRGSAPQGFAAAAADRKAAADRIARIRRHGFFVERRKAEQNSSWKQVIPYVVVRKGDSILLLERTGKQGEARLHGKLSIGVGGHVNPVDTQGDPLFDGLRRELEEELAVTGPIELRAAGFLNDDSTDVGAVHYGLVAVADARRAEVAIRETELMSGRFVSTGELGDLCRRERARFESWSSLLIDRLDDVLASDLSLEEVFAARA